MTQEQISEIAQLQEKAAALRDEASQVDDQRKGILQMCDHQHPDGTSAWRDQWLFDMCEICCMSDDI